MPRYKARRVEACIAHVGTEDVVGEALKMAGARAVNRESEMTESHVNYSLSLCLERVGETERDEVKEVGVNN